MTVETDRERLVGDPPRGDVLGPGAHPPALVVEDLSVSLGGRPVLRQVSFTVEAGGFCGLIGANGAGKTTLLRAILGLVPPSGGRVVVTGGARSRRRDPQIGYVPQKLALEPDVPLRARDLVGLGLDGHRFGISLPDTRRRRAIGEMLEAVGAAAFADARIGTLSGGEQQRIMIAQALISRPKLLLLDEPLANLDIRSAAGVVDLLARIATQEQIAILLSAHDINPLLPAMDRVVYLADGRAVSGTAEEVIQTDTLSRLYGHHVEVIRAQGRVLVVSGAEHQTHHAGDTDPYGRET
ncbi:MAG TPA: metal ABC transporter ATP-binding protein [Acidimicrobiales bacterium]|nr:metal ABC transporter ATP-binding protein [Acidimicrobiales bacterium]